MESKNKDKLKEITLPYLPNIGEVETKPVLKKLSMSYKALAELKGVASSMPNQIILFSTLSLQEAKDSSAIENIVTTQDDIYQSDFKKEQFTTLAAKEVHYYADAMIAGYDEIKKTGLLSLNNILKVHEGIEKNDAGFRKIPGTILENNDGEAVYKPPQDISLITELMENLEKFINDDSLCDWDPLVKMAVIHHQFESIHPFYDGNGRTGRVINILYLVLKGLIDTPILYLSRYINRNKLRYYQLLQGVREKNEWEEWIIFMLNGVEETSIATTKLIRDIKNLMLEYKHRIRKELKRIYSQDLINNLFRHPYTKIDFLVSDLHVSRQTASRYLTEIEKIGLVSKHKLGNENFYLNDSLFNLLLRVSDG